MVLNEVFDVPTPLELVKMTIRSLANKTEWTSKSAFQKWCYLFGIGRPAANLLGFPVFRDDHKTYWFSYVIFVYDGIDVVLVFYTIYYFLNRGEFESILPCIPVLIGPIFASLPVAYASVTEGASMFKSLINFGGRYIYPNSKDNSEYNEICSKHIDATVRSFFIKMGMIVLSFISALLWPGYAYFMHGIKTTGASCKIPYTEIQSNEEFLVNLSLSFAIGIHGFIGYIALEVGMSLYNDIVTLIPKLVDLELKKLDGDIAKNEISAIHVASTLKNAIKQSLDVDNFLRDLGNALYYRTLVTPPLFTYAIGLAIFCQYSMGFAAGYGIAMMCYVQLYYMCDFGDQVEKNGFDEVLYNSKWYNLPPKYQMYIKFLIIRKQNGVAMTVGPFGNINRELFAVISNKIYSFVMFLLNVSA